MTTEFPRSGVHKKTREGGGREGSNPGGNYDKVSNGVAPDNENLLSLK